MADQADNATDNASGATDAPAATASPPAAPAPAAAKAEAAAEEGEWSPAPMKDGIAYDGHGLPINHRLRAAALAEAGEEADPSGAISPERIADEVKRLEAYDKAHPDIAANATKDDLIKQAKSESVTLSDDMTNEERREAILAARPRRI